MKKENDFTTLKYFLEGYFNMSANYDELESLSKKFCALEEEGYRIQLKSELKQIKEEHDWKSLREFVRRYGERNPKSDEKLQWIIDTILINIE